VAVSPVYQP